MSSRASSEREERRNSIIGTYASHDFPIVCIGMSAGGVEPLLEIFRSLSPQTGMAFVVMHHLKRTPTMLPQILSKSTAMPVQLAEAGLVAKPNRVYVLPSGAEISMADGFFRLGARKKLTGWTNVFTVMLQSLSSSHHPGIAIVLSGADANGAAAIKPFKKNGGITIAQAPESAERPQMPTAAIETGCVDYVLPPRGISQRLEQIAEEWSKTGSIRTA